MKVAVVVCAILSVACGAAIYPYPAPTLIRTPHFDSAVITSERLGGNFAYSSQEAHAYAAVSPVVQNVITPVGVSYHATPLQYPAVYPGYAPAVVASAPVAPVYPALAPFAPIAPIVPIAPVAAEDAPAAEAPAAEAPAAPETPADAPEAPATAPEAPAADFSEPDSSASSDDTVSIEAA